MQLLWCRGLSVGFSCLGDVPAVGLSCDLPWVHLGGWNCLCLDQGSPWPLPSQVSHQDPHPNTSFSNMIAEHQLLWSHGFGKQFICLRKGHSIFYETNLLLKNKVEPQSTACQNMNLRSFGLEQSLMQVTALHSGPVVLNISRGVEC